MDTGAPAAKNSLAGMTVCVTGELIRSYEGERLTSTGQPRACPPAVLLDFEPHLAGIGHSSL
jgi:hypothetical protein